MNDESTPKGAHEAWTASLDPSSCALDLMAETACRDEWGNCKQGCVDSFAAGVAVGRQQALDELAAAAWPRAREVVANAARSIDVTAARRKADERAKAVASA